ncbi:MAG: helix-turn-helix domain-containing protein [Cyanobacteria bacterium J06638_22]
MGRKRSEQRFQALIVAATKVFLAQGYRRAQIADIAQAMGVAKGTVYLYVESKEALFDLVLRHGDVLFPIGKPGSDSDAPHPILALPATLPVPTPDSASTLQFVAEELIEADPVPLLSQALSQDAPSSVSAELEGILRQLYRKMYRHRVSMKLIDRCAREYPELAAVFFQAGRTTVMQSLVQYLGLRIQQGYFRPVPDRAIAARMILENLTYWAIHRHWDPAPYPMDDRTVEDTIITLLMTMLLQEAHHDFAQTRPALG